MKRFLYGLAALGLLVGVAGHVKGQGQFSFTMFAAPGSTETHLNKVNDLGIAVGSATYGDGTTQGLILDTNTGNLTNFVAPGSIYTALFGINNWNLMVGLSGDAALNYTAFFTDGSTVTPINQPDAFLTVATAINDSNQKTGYLYDRFFNVHGFKQEADGSSVTLDVPGSTATFAVGMNTPGDICGYRITPAGKPGGFLLNNGNYITDFPVIPSGWTITSCFALTDVGECVGAADDGTGVIHGVWLHGSFITLDPPGATSSEAHGINNSSVIVGIGTFPNGTIQAWVANPIF